MVKMNQALVRSRPLKKVGAEQVSLTSPPLLRRRAPLPTNLLLAPQLLLDFSIIKRCLVELPLFPKDDSRSIQCVLPFHALLCPPI